MMKDSQGSISKGFPFYGVTLTYTDSAHFFQLAEQNSKMCRICISQRDAIERTPFIKVVVWQKSHKRAVRMRTTCLVAFYSCKELLVLVRLS